MAVWTDKTMDSVRDYLNIDKKAGWKVERKAQRQVETKLYK